MPSSAQVHSARILERAALGGIKAYENAPADVGASTGAAGANDHEGTNRPHIRGTGTGTEPLCRPEQNVRAVS
jgi:hypothetical protein